MTLLGNIIGANDEGIEIEKATNTTIRANRVYSSTYYGLNLTAAEELTVVDNYFNNRENVLVPTGSFTGVWSQESRGWTERDGQQVYWRELLGDP